MVAPRGFSTSIIRGRRQNMGSDFQDTSSEVLVISVQRDGDRTILTLEGELDLHGSARLTAAVEDALHEHAQAIEIDATRLTFADSAGLRAVLLARSAAERSGALLRLSKVSEPVGRVIDIAGLGDVLLPADN
jgi:anti-anti-sigma factor